MAYKFQDGAAKLAGSITGSLSITAGTEVSGSGKGSFGSLVLDGAANLQSAGITNAGTIAGATSVSGSGAGSFGSLTLDGALALQSAGITAAGPIAGATTVSGSGAGSFGSLTLDGAANLQSGGITNAGAIAGATTVDSTGLASLDGGIDVNGSNFTAGTDGAVTATSLNVQTGAITNASTVSGSGAGSFGSLTLDGAANLQSAGITAAGSIAGATSVSGSGAGSFGSLTLDGALALQSAGITAAGAIAGATTVNAVSLTASANMVADKFFGDGAGITNINVGNLDAAGSDSQVQFNQNGEFAASAKLTFDGSGSVEATGSLTVANSAPQIYVKLDPSATGTPLLKLRGHDQEAGDYFVLYNSNGEGASDKVFSISGSGATVIPNADINGGSIDDTAIGAATPAAATVTTLTVNDTLTLAGEAAIEADDASSTALEVKGYDPSQTDGSTNVVEIWDTDGGTKMLEISSSGVTTIGKSNFKVSSGTISGSSTISGLGITGTSLALQSGGITAAGAIAGATTVSGSGAGSFGSLTLDGAIALQSAGITAAGPIAGATSVSGSGAGSFGSLTLDGAANLQSAGITNAGAIAGVTSMATADVTYGDSGITIDSDGGHFTIEQDDADKSVRVVLGATGAGTSGFGIRQADNTQIWGVIDTGNVSGSGAVSAGGGLILAGALGLQSSGITAAGSIAGATTVSGSGAGSFGSLTLDGALALQSAGITAAGALAGVTTIVASSTISGSGLASFGGGMKATGVVSGSGNVSVGGDLLYANVATAAAADLQLASAGLIVFDDTNQKLVKADWTNLVSASAGSGISFSTSTGKFSIDTQTVTILTEGTTTDLLTEGINAFSGAIGRNHTVQLPAAAAANVEVGDTYTVKLGTLSTAGLTVTITGSSESGSIDGESSVVLESPYGSVTLIRLDTDGNFMIT